MREQEEVAVVVGDAEAVVHQGPADNMAAAAAVAYKPRATAQRAAGTAPGSRPLEVACTEDLAVHKWADKCPEVEEAGEKAGECALPWCNWGDPFVGRVPDEA